jgi:hypothetical protein
VQKRAAKACCSAVMYISYQLVAEDGRVGSTYAEEQKMGAVNGIGKCLSHWYCSQIST